MPDLKKLTAFAFYEWVEKYNASGLCPTSKPTMQAINSAKECNAIVCSDLPRSKESAKVLNAEAIVLSRSLSEN